MKEGFDAIESGPGAGGTDALTIQWRTRNSRNSWRPSILFATVSGSASAIEGLRKALAQSKQLPGGEGREDRGRRESAGADSQSSCGFRPVLCGSGEDRSAVLGQNAIAKALAEMGYDEPAPYLRGLRHVQLEPSWGGSSDSAATLRAQCAVAVVQCRSVPDLVLLSHLLELLFDPIKNVRVEAARAIGRVTRTEAALILRVRSLAGDREPEVLGACFSALLSIEGGDGIGFVSRFLDNGGDVGGEAALALGMLREHEALAVLKERWPRERDPAWRRCC